MPIKDLFTCSRHKDDGPLGSDRPLGGDNPPAYTLEAPEISNREKESPEPGFPESSTEIRTLNVQYDTYWNLHTTIHLRDSDQGNELYTVEARNRKPQMKIHSHANNTEMATAIFHNLKTRIDMNLRGQEFSLQSGGWQTRYSYTSPLTGENMTWRPRKRLDDLNMVLLNGSGLAIARYVPRYKGSKRGGTLELLPECWKSEQMWEEVIAIFLAVSHYKESQRIIAAAAATA